MFVEHAYAAGAPLSGEEESPEWLDTIIEELFTEGGSDVGAWDVNLDEELFSDVAIEQSADSFTDEDGASGPASGEENLRLLLQAASDSATEPLAEASEGRLFLANPATPCRQLQTTI